MKPGQITLVFVQYGTENDPSGALLMSHPLETELERTNDKALIEASVRVENRQAQGIVAAVVGTDLRYHFHHHLSTEELVEHGIVAKGTR